MVTLNVAEHFHLDHLIGSLAPGKMADILISPSPEEFSPQLVMCNGNVLFQDGRRLVEPEKVFFPDHMLRTVDVRKAVMPALPTSGKVRAIEMVARLVTKEKVIDLGSSEDVKDLIMIYALDRCGSGKGFMGYLKGFGLQEGAYGTTMCWDTRDLIAVGCDQRSIATVVERLGAIGGGGVFAVGEEIIAEFCAPICGVASPDPMEKIRDATRQLDDSLRARGVRWDKPILTVDCFGTAAIPHLRINHNGYVNLKDRKVLAVRV